MEKFKSLLSISLVTITLTASVANAAPQKPVQVPTNTITQLESRQTYTEPVSNNKVLGVPVKIGSLRDNGWLNKTTKEIEKEKFKKALQEFYNTDPVKNADRLKNIDAMVESAATKTPATISSLQGVISPEIYIISQGFDYGSPYKTGTSYWVTYSTLWLTEDNYRSSVPVTVGQTRSLSTSTKLGFTGSNEIKVKMSFTAEYTATQTSTVSVGATVPGWTVWGYRPYIRWSQDDWKGTYSVTYVSDAGQIFTISEEKTGANRLQTIKSNEYWSRVNTAKNVYASTPTPPTGAPL